MCLLCAGRQAELIGRQGRSSETAGRCHSGRRGRLLGRLRHGGQTIHKGLPLLVYGGQALNTQGGALLHGGYMSDCLLTDGFPAASASRKI